VDNCGGGVWFIVLEISENLTECSSTRWFYIPVPWEAVEKLHQQSSVLCTYPMSVGRVWRLITTVTGSEFHRVSSPSSVFTEESGNLGTFSNLVLSSLLVTLYPILSNAHCGEAPTLCNHRSPFPFDLRVAEFNNSFVVSPAELRFFLENIMRFYVRFEVSTAVTMMIIIFWEMIIIIMRFVYISILVKFEIMNSCNTAPYNFIDGYQRSEGTTPSIFRVEVRGTRFFRNVGNYIQS
jgi:hypothetical protein